MSKKLTHKECFEFFGTIPKNPRWSWSGRSPDGKVVSVTFWQDQFEEGGRVYRGRRRSGEKGMSKPGRAELLENLKWARDHCDGILRIIIAIAKDTKAEPRSILECFPQKTLRMRLIHLDLETGEYVAERIEDRA
jgi:hypothetical protein